eukprot:CAMPEP_0168400994 /NCGR_PEP_ID=MMETSP0228-20121227/22881_1 /TAXON_ID=133427 /ORGANISM="Protoceratium reticulatum, Strain CCCM 535 (=CCMP 1889)" /LENGTH=78 /DNA_ID=CAMNT_0008414545 /DNA_START=86 /DNA_END=322 /DNA_ORIENTATION=-
MPIHWHGVQQGHGAAADGGLRCASTERTQWEAAPQGLRAASRISFVGPAWGCRCTVAQWRFGPPALQAPRALFGILTT